MSKFSHIINNFISGEVSPRLYGRTDSETYKNSSREIKNMQVLPQGGVQRRVGTQFIYDKAHSDDNPSTVIDIGGSSRIVPFTYSKTEKYLILFSTDTASSVVCNVYNVEEDSWFVFPIYSAYASHAQPRIDDTNKYFDDPLNDATTLAEMQFAQKGNILLITHENFPPILIRRKAKNEFACSHWYVRDENNNLTRPDFNETTPFRSNTDSNHTMTVTGTFTLGGAITITSNLSFFSVKHIGSYMAIKDNDGANLGYMQITAFTSATVVTGVVSKTLAAMAAVNLGVTKEWAEAYWSHYRGWPRTCTFAEGRLIFAGSPSYPDAVWFTQTFDIFEWSNTAVLDPGTALTEDDPGTIFPSSREVNEITWVKGGNRNVLVGTRGAEYSMSRLSGLPEDVATGEAMTKFAAQSSHGSEYIQPVAIDEQTIYMQRGYRKIRDMVFDNRIEAYRSVDRTFLAEHITRKSLEDGSNLTKIKQFAYQELDNKILWVIDNNGKMTYATIDSESQVNAWAHADIGGAGVEVQSICTLPSKNGTADELYLLVKRDIDGGTKVYLEKMGNDFYRDSLNVDSNIRENLPVFCDCSKTFRLHSSPYVHADLGVTDEMEIGATTVAATLTGTQSFSEGYMKLIAGSYATYTLPGVSGDDGVVRLRCKLDDLNLSQTLVSLHDSGGGNNDRVEIKYLTTFPRHISFEVFSSTGVSIFAITVPLGVNTGDSELTPLYIEANWDVAAGDNSLYVNEASATSTATGSRGSAVDTYRIGADHLGANTSRNSFFKDFEFYPSLRVNRGEVYEYQLSEEFGTTVENKAFADMDYLEGQGVQVVADGNYLGTFTVTGGVVTVTNTPPAGGWSTVTIGLTYEHLIELNEIEAGGSLGNSQGEIKRIDRLVGRFNKTAQCSFGDTETNQKPITFRDPDSPMGDPIGLYTGDKVLDFDGDVTRNATVVLTGDAPLPCNITCLIIRGITYG